MWLLKLTGYKRERPQPSWVAPKAIRFVYMWQRKCTTNMTPYGLGLLWKIDDGEVTIQRCDLRNDTQRNLANW